MSVNIRLREWARRLIVGYDSLAQNDRRSFPETFDVDLSRCWILLSLQSEYHGTDATRIISTNNIHRLDTFTLREFRASRVYNTNALWFMIT